MKFIESIFHWAQQTPQKVAHQSGDLVLTYGELFSQARHFANHLSALSKVNVPVVIQGHKEPEMLIGFVGCILARRPYVPIDISLPADRVNLIIQAAETEDIFTASQIKELVASASKHTIADEAFNQLPNDLIRPSDPVYIMFTSGSTGTPKGVVISAGSLQDFIDWMKTEQCFVNGNEVFFDQAPFSFDLSVMELYLSLTTGSTLYSITREEIANPASLFKRIAAGNLTVWVSTPSFAQMVLREKSFTAEHFPTLKKFLFCGEPLLKETALALIEGFPLAEVWNTYGPTEATVATTSVLITKTVAQANSRLPIGYSKPGSKVLILDEANSPVPYGEKGEIVIVGPNVGDGYYKRDDLTKAAFFRYQDQPAYRTGDVGFTATSDEKLLYCDGRKDFQIKLHGYRIELGDIEAHLRTCNTVLDAVVVPKMKDGAVELLAAFIIKKSDDSLEEFAITRALKKQLSQIVPPYMVPSRFIYIDLFPTTPNDKIDRNLLARMIP